MHVRPAEVAPNGLWLFIICEHDESCSLKLEIDQLDTLPEGGEKQVGSKGRKVHDVYSMSVAHCAIQGGYDVRASRVMIFQFLRSPIRFLMQRSYLRCRGSRAIPGRPTFAFS
jgi:hypothetical protein